jgi:hypothetical protein
LAAFDAQVCGEFFAVRVDTIRRLDAQAGRARTVDKLDAVVDLTQPRNASLECNLIGQIGFRRRGCKAHKVFGAVDAYFLHHVGTWTKCICIVHKSVFDMCRRFACANRCHANGLGGVFTAGQPKRATGEAWQLGTHSSEHTRLKARNIGATRCGNLHASVRDRNRTRGRR